MSDDAWLGIYACVATVNWFFHWRWKVVAEQKLEDRHRITAIMQTQRDNAYREALRLKAKLDAVKATGIYDGEDENETSIFDFCSACGFNLCACNDRFPDIQLPGDCKK